jgi:hypothetical protein
MRHVRPAGVRFAIGRTKTGDGVFLHRMNTQSTLTREGRRRAGTALAVAAFAGLPAAAQAATLKLDRLCYRTNQTVHMSGNGYSPSGKVNISLDGGAFGSLPTNANGAFSGVFRAPPPLPEPTSVRNVSLTTTDNADPTLTATTTLQIVHTNVNVNPAVVTPGKVTYSALGFTSGNKLYIHYVLHGKLVVTRKLGKLTGPCSSLQKKVRMFMFRPVKPGNYTLVFDTSRQYLPKFRPSFSFQAPVRTTFS